MKFLSSLKSGLFEPERKVTPGELVFFKFFEFFVLLYTIWFSWKWARYIFHRNTEVVLPLGYANYLDVSLFFGNHLPFYMAGFLTVLLLCAYFRIGARWFYMVAFFLLQLLHFTRFSQGEIPHSQAFIGISLLCLGIGSVAFGGARSMPRFVMGTLFFFMGLAYTSAFFSKLIGTGIHWADGRHLWLWISEKSVDILSREGTYSLNFIQQAALKSTAFASLLLLFGWITEFFGFTLWWSRFRPYTFTLLIGLHIGIMLSMNIRFDAFLLQFIIVGYPWYRLIDRYLDTTPAFVARTL